MVVDPATLGMHASYGFPGQFCTDWLHTLSQAKDNTSMYSQRKLIYTLFQRHGFDINTIRARYNELKPGQLYKLLNTKQKVILLAIYL